MSSFQIRPPYRASVPTLLYPIVGCGSIVSTLSQLLLWLRKLHSYTTTQITGMRQEKKKLNGLLVTC